MSQNDTTTPQTSNKFVLSDIPNPVEAFNLWFEKPLLTMLLGDNDLASALGPKVKDVIPTKSHEAVKMGFVSGYTEAFAWIKDQLIAEAKAKGIKLPIPVHPTAGSDTPQ